LLGEVLDDPEKNTEKYLKDRIKELGKLSDEHLKAITEKAHKERNTLETKRDEMTKKKYWVS